jgi:hypothetical protein
MSARNLFNKAGRKLFFCMLIISFVLPLRAEESVALERVELEGHAKTQIPEKENLENLTWEGKKFLFGMGAFSGMTLYFYSMDSVAFPDFIQVDARFMLNPNMPLLLSLSMFGIVSFPFTINLGYGRSFDNVYWYIAGGGGFVFNDGFSSGLNYRLNICTGADLLILKSYSVGLQINLGEYLSSYEGEMVNRFFINLSIKANLVM